MTAKSRKFPEFCAQESVAVFIAATRGSKVRNLKYGMERLRSTQYTFARALYKFDGWLEGKKFEFYDFVRTGESSYIRKKKSTTIRGVEHLLKLYQESDSRREFAGIIKQYLNDPIHAKKTAGTVNVIYSAIRKYFRDNDSSIEVNFNPRISHRIPDETDGAQSLSLDEFFKMLTVGRPSILQRAVFLCKFHRGLDNITFCDRFNFQAWQQLVKWFGTVNYEKWDTGRCPVPIILQRIKTDYVHTGFLDKDAIDAICTYLKHRKERTGQEMKEGQPLFINQKGKPVGTEWIRRNFGRMAETAKVQRYLPGYTSPRKCEKSPHEMRDLLESTLLDSGCRMDVVEHCIGHKPANSYQKQAILYPESLRREFAKASNRINLFSAFAGVVGNNGEIPSETDSLASILRDRITEVERIKYDILISAAHSMHAKVESLIEAVGRLERRAETHTEFCCAACNMIHTKVQCPSCGSRHRRMFQISSHDQLQPRR